ncbi:MAG: hypothetical protein H0Z28_13760 [Archaeoglobus sp.]|nr:hypothetical protein [Archaeoglobus sp.]
MKGKSKIFPNCFRLNARSESKTFGEIELKYISNSDLKFFFRLLNRVKDDREFVTQVLYHQLTTPKVSFTEFNKIPDDELIEIARDFIEHEHHTFQYFRETTDTEFFINFKKAIKTYHQKRIEQLQITFGPAIESSKRILETFETFNQQYAGIINIIKQSTFFTELKRLNTAISMVDKWDREHQHHILESLSPVIKQYQLTEQFLSKTLMPQIDFWGKWVERNKAIFNIYTRFWQNFQQKYKIAKQEAVQILRKYKWFITPSLPLSFVFEVVKIGKRKGNQRKAINGLFIDYFSLNNFGNLEKLVDGWQTNKIFKPRMKIFRDCVSVMRNAKSKYNPSTIVLPTLIAQIDGIQREFMEQNGLSFDLKKGKWVDKKGNIIYWKAWFKGQTSNQEWLDLANDIFLGILFQESQPGRPLETPFTFNRHKIMHGEYLRYGRIDNTIRAFLILDFLATLSNREDKS